MFGTIYYLQQPMATFCYRFQGYSLTFLTKVFVDNKNGNPKSHPHLILDKREKYFFYNSSFWKDGQSSHFVTETFSQSLRLMFIPLSIPNNNELM